VLEGLGTKNLVADEVDAQNPDQPSAYYSIAQDNIAMIVNDLAGSGASLLTFWIHVAAGESAWFTDARRTQAFNMGCAAVCNQVGMTWAGGESPALPGIIVPGASEISGFVLGEVSPKERYVAGDKLEDGDAVILVESSGIHANGLSAARKLREGLPGGYQTLLQNGKTFGETLLTPTHLYANTVQALLDESVTIKRLENITGHGWRKIMRGKQPFTYRMHELPPELPIFPFLQEHLQVDDAEMFGNYNMGAGFAVYTPQKEVDRTLTVIADQGFTALHAGNVEEGPKQVIIEPKRLVLPGSSLAVRA
jgi:phosphoribosylformylglycinamidine cyclo-ligase